MGASRWSGREIIEIVKFHFIEKGIIGRRYLPGSEENLLDLKKLQESLNDQSVYDPEEDFDFS